MHVVVIGAGAFGSWTALWLLRRGATVTLVEQYGPGNSLSSSGDESRVTRSAHGLDDHYPRWQRRSLIAGHFSHEFSRRLCVSERFLLSTSAVLAAELSVACRVAKPTMAGRIAEAGLIVHAFPATLSALEAGRIEAGHVRAMTAGPATNNSSWNAPRQ